MNKKIIYFGITGIVILFILFNLSGPTKTQNEQDKQLSKAASISHAHGLVVDITDPEIAYIATHYGLLVLKNGELYELGDKKDDYMGFIAHPSEAGVFFSSGHPSSGGNLGVQKSIDGGVSWDKISSGINGPVDFHAMAISSANPKILYGFYRNALQRSDDGGTNWQLIGSGLPIIQLATDPQNESVLYAATPNSIQISSDKGKTWSAFSKELENEQIISVAVNPNDNKNILALSMNRGLIRTVNGKNWETVNNFKTEPILQIAFSKSDPKVAYAIAGGDKLYKSVDNGITWSQIK